MDTSNIESDDEVDGPAYQNSAEEQQLNDFMENLGLGVFSGNGVNATLPAVHHQLAPDTLLYPSSNHYELTNDDNIIVTAPQPRRPVFHALAADSQYFPQNSGLLHVGSSHTTPDLPGGDQHDIRNTNNASSFLREEEDTMFADGLGRLQLDSNSSSSGWGPPQTHRNFASELARPNSTPVVSMGGAASDYNFHVRGASSGYNVQGGVAGQQRIYNSSYQIDASEYILQQQQQQQHSSTGGSASSSSLSSYPVPSAQTTSGIAGGGSLTQPLTDIDRRLYGSGSVGGFDEDHFGLSGSTGGGGYSEKIIYPNSGNGGVNSGLHHQHQQMSAQSRMQQQQQQFSLPPHQLMRTSAYQRPASTPLPSSDRSSAMIIGLGGGGGGGGGGVRGPPMTNLSNMEDSSVEETVAKSCRDILIEAANNSLKAVELANTLRARVGTEVLAHIRERWGGLLSLLERHLHVFRVDRIPKNDLVTLISISGVAPVTGGEMNQNQQQGAGPRGGGFMMHEQTSSPSPQPFAGGSTSGSYHQQQQQQIDLQRLTADRRTPPIYYQQQQLHGSSGLGSTPSPGPTGSGMLSIEGSVSRCLHVGNVPANMTEAQLLRELTRYGEVDCLKLVCQRSRRFAFVSFRTIEQAVSAKQRMSRIHPWKSAISFAHKESQSQSLASLSNTPSPAPSMMADYPAAAGHSSEAGYSIAYSPDQHQQHLQHQSSSSPSSMPSSLMQQQLSMSPQLMSNQHKVFNTSGGGGGILPGGSLSPPPSSSGLNINQMPLPPQPPLPFARRQSPAPPSSSSSSSSLLLGIGSDRYSSSSSQVIYGSGTAGGSGVPPSSLTTFSDFPEIHGQGHYHHGSSGSGSGLSSLLLGGGGVGGGGQQSPAAPLLGKGGGGGGRRSPAPADASGGSSFLLGGSSSSSSSSSLHGEAPVAGGGGGGRSPLLQAASAASGGAYLQQQQPRQRRLSDPFVYGGHHQQQLHQQQQDMLLGGRSRFESSFDVNHEIDPRLTTHTANSSSPDHIYNPIAIPRPTTQFEGGGVGSLTGGGGGGLDDHGRGGIMGGGGGSWPSSSSRFIEGGSNGDHSGIGFRTSTPDAGGGGAAAAAYDRGGGGLPFGTLHHQSSSSSSFQHQQQSHSLVGGDRGGGGGGDEAVLRRLCDDTYVPTQPWPVRWDADSFYCNAVIAQLQQFGGATTISKLRGFLRSRLNAPDNIKSVPLKAMLVAYPEFFVVRSNQVSLVSGSAGSGMSHHHQQQQPQYAATSSSSSGGGDLIYSHHTNQHHIRSSSTNNNINYNYSNPPGAQLVGMLSSSSSLGLLGSGGGVNMNHDHYRPSQSSGSSSIPLHYDNEIMLPSSSSTSFYN